MTSIIPAELLPPLPLFSTLIFICVGIASVLNQSFMLIVWFDVIVVSIPKYVLFNGIVSSVKTRSRKPSKLAYCWFIIKISSSNFSN